MAHKRYDLQSAVAQRLADLLTANHPSAVPDLDTEFYLVEGDARSILLREVAARQGQGAFRVRLIDAYRGRCAATGERALPVLEAAHIQPYLGPASNHVQNGLLLRADLHRLYDDGYLTVTPDLRMEVSSRLKSEFDNGEPYYPLAGRQISVPREPHLRPSPKALAWHANNVFR